MRVMMFAPNLEKIRAWFDIPKRYYQRNKEMVGLVRSCTPLSVRRTDLLAEQRSR